jgi:hypothetical protein
MIVMLLCGVLLRAANNHGSKFVNTNTVKEKITKIEVKKNMEFVPNIFLL